MSNAYAAGVELTADALNNPASSYWFSQRVYFTASGTFSKGSYPGLRAVRVTCIGGGGGGGGAASAAGGNAAIGGGGGAGGTVYGTFLAASLGTNETVTVGAAGTAGTAGANTGGTGGTSSFGSLATATGGTGGGGGSAGTGAGFSSVGGDGGGGSGGDLAVDGGEGFNGVRGASGVVASQGYGGASSIAGMTRCPTTASGNVGRNGRWYGGGASGGYDVGASTARAGGTGGPGIVIVDLYF